MAEPPTRACEVTGCRGLMVADTHSFTDAYGWEWTNTPGIERRYWVCNAAGMAHTFLETRGKKKETGT